MIEKCAVVINWVLIVIFNTFADYLLEREFESDRDFRVLIPRIGRLMEPTPMRFRDYEPSERYFRETRFALLLGKFEDFKANYYRTIQNSGTFTRFSQKEMVKLFLPDAFDLEKLEKINPRIRAFLLMERLVIMSFDLGPSDAYYDYVINNISKLPETEHANIARLSAQLAMFRGDWATVSKLSTYFDDLQSAVFLGWQTLLRGSATEAVDIFSTGLKSLRKITKNPKEFLTSLAREPPAWQPGPMFLDFGVGENSRITGRFRHHLYMRYLPGPPHPADCL